MSFWSNAKEPLRVNRFLFTGLGLDKIMIKSVSLPSFDSDMSEHQLMNHQFRLPGIGKWGDLTVTGVAKRSDKFMRGTSYNSTSAEPHRQTLGKGNVKSPVAGLPQIKLLNAKGQTVQTWTLYGAVVSSISYSDLDYSQDDFVTVEVTVSIDYASIN